MPCFSLPFFIFYINIFFIFDISFSHRGCEGTPFPSSACPVHVAELAYKYLTLES